MKNRTFIAILSFILGINIVFILLSMNIVNRQLDDIERMKVQIDEIKLNMKGVIEAC
jgi:ABC-type antimicrobial peptide transport system permease subunit